MDSRSDHHHLSVFVTTTDLELCSLPCIYSSCCCSRNLVPESSFLLLIPSFSFCCLALALSVTLDRGPLDLCIHTNRIVYPQRSKTLVYQDRPGRETSTALDSYRLAQKESYSRPHCPLGIEHTTGASFRTIRRIRRNHRHCTLALSLTPIYTPTLS